MYYEDDDALTLRKSLLKEGATYVRVVAYVKDKSGNKKYGTPSNVVTVNVSKATSAISNLKLVEKTPDGYVFSYDGTVRKEEDVEFWYSESPEFVNDYKVTDCISAENNKATLYFESLTPGKTYYVRARVKNDKAATLAHNVNPFSCIQVSVLDSLTFQHCLHERHEFLNFFFVHYSFSNSLSAKTNSF